MYEVAPGHPEGLVLAHAVLLDVAQFTVGLTVQDPDEFTDEAWLAIRDYSKENPRLKIGDPFDRLDICRSVIKLDPPTEALYMRFPYMLHHDAMNRIVHIESLNLPLVCPPPAQEPIVQNEWRLPCAQQLFKFHE